MDVSRCVQCWTTETKGGEAVRVDETSRIELSERLLRHPAATRLTLDRPDGVGVTRENTNLFYTQRNYNPPSKTALTSSTILRSVKNGQRSVSSVSWGSLNQEETGTALLGWKMYEAGELSRIMVSDIGRPSCDKSCRQKGFNP